MDDILPIFIYVVSQANITHIVSEINLLMDYVKLLDDGYDLECRLLSNVEAAVGFIASDWVMSMPVKEEEKEEESN